MSAEMQEMINFHLTGKRGDSGPRNAQGSEICPVLLAPYRDLTQLRYDFPLILLDNDSKNFVETLSGVINRLLRSIAPEGKAGARLRQHVLRLETRMRELVNDGAETSLSGMWGQAAKSLTDECKENEAEILGNDLATARFALHLDGQVVDCDDRLPARLLEHAWAKTEMQRTRSTHLSIHTLVIRLRNILKVDDLKTSRSRTPQMLKKTLGRRYKDAFDFDLMAELLDPIAHNRLPSSRRARIRSALAVLESQRFFVATNNDNKASQYGFVFDSLASALKAYYERLPEMASVVKAMSIAELECENAYREKKHSAYFDRFDIRALAPQDLALFPSYLVCQQESKCDMQDTARLMEIVSSDLPMKVLLQVTNALGESSAIDGHPNQGPCIQRLASSLSALGTACVLQSPVSNLYQHREQIRKSLEFSGPAIFSVFTCSRDSSTGLPDYLIAAAAMESRVFPAFSYDPAAGRGLVDRFSIRSNPDLESAWPRRQLSYEDEALQKHVEDCAFTLADYAVIDPRYREHFAPVPRDAWNDDMLPVSEYLELTDADSLRKVPFIPVVDDKNMLQRLVVDDNLVRMARRCRDRWHVLQELGGVDNSYASAHLAEERTAWEEERDRQLSDLRAEFARTERTAPQLADTGPIDAGEQETGQTEAAADESAVAMSGEAYIETPRCTTCDECTNRNDRMFAYDENKQAYIKDPDAGTYRELIEAAESCQVAIIHPGKPRNPSEPGLDDLIARAQAFMT
jgi:hypothetical protein